MSTTDDTDFACIRKLVERHDQHEIKRFGDSSELSFVDGSGEDESRFVFSFDIDGNLTKVHQESTEDARRLIYGHESMY